MDPSQSRKAVTVAAKSEVTKNDEDRRRSELHSLPYQGRMWRSLDHNSGDIWAQAVQLLPERAFKFALNAAHDTLPHNANLHIWHKKPTNQCPLCKEDVQNLCVGLLGICDGSITGMTWSWKKSTVLSKKTCPNLRE